MTKERTALVPHRSPVEISRSERLALTAGDYDQMLKLIALESVDGMTTVLRELIRSSDSLSRVMRDNRGKRPEPISDETRRLLVGRTGAEDGLVGFIDTPMALDWLAVLNGLRLVPSGEVAEVAKHLVDHGLLPKRNESWMDRTTRKVRGGAKQIILRLPEGAIALAEIPQVMAFFDVARWWAQRVVEAQEIADAANRRLNSHLNEGDEIAEIAKMAVTALEKYEGEMELAQRSLDEVLKEGGQINIMTDGDERVGDARRARDLLASQADLERRQAEAATKLTAAVLQLDELVNAMDERYGSGKNALTVHLASIRRLAVTERGLKVTLATIRLIMSAAIAQGYIAQAACLSRAVDDYEMLLVDAVEEAVNSANSHHQLLVAPAGKQSDARSKDGQEVVEGEFTES